MTPQSPDAEAASPPLLDIDPRFHFLPAEWQLAMRALRSLHGTPEAMSIQIILGAANAVTQRYWNIDSNMYGVRPTNLFLLNMTPTAGRKSTNLREIAQAIDDYQRQQASLLSGETVRWAIDKKLYEKRLRQYERDMEEGTGAILPEAPDAAETAEYIISTATLNGIIDILRSQSWCSLMTSEGGEFFNGHSWQGGKADAARAISMSAALTSMWDGHDIMRNTGMDRTKLVNRRVNMLILLQEPTVRAVLSNPMFAEQGFLHRILITQCDDPPFQPRTASTARDYHYYQTLLEPFHARLRAMLARPQQPGPRRFEVAAAVMTLDQAASDRMIDYYNHMGGVVRPQHPSLTGFVSRCHEQALRIAATLADFAGLDRVDSQSAQAACDLMEFYLEQRVGLEIGITDPNQEVRAATDRLAGWLDRHPQGWFTRRELGHRVKWFAKLTADFRDRILEEAVRLELVQARQRRPGTLEFASPVAEPAHSDLGQTANRV